MTNEPNRQAGGNHAFMIERTVSIAEAAHILGTSTEALRKRIKRGTVKARKNGDGQWLVVLDGTESWGNVQEDSKDIVHDSMPDVHSESSPLEEALRDEVTFLREEISFLHEEVGRLDSIIMALTQNVKLLETSKHRPEVSRLSWWSRLKNMFVSQHKYA
jgi:hypothetical protein